MNVHQLPRFPIGTATERANLGLVTRRKSRDEIKLRRQVTRRDETRDCLVQFDSRPKLTRRDKTRDQVHKKQNFTQNFDPRVDIFAYVFLLRRSCEAKSRDETRRDGLVSSRVFSKRDRLVTGPTKTLLYRSRMPPFAPPAENVKLLPRLSY